MYTEKCEILEIVINTIITIVMIIIIIINLYKCVAFTTIFNKITIVIQKYLHVLFQNLSECATVLSGLSLKLGSLLNKVILILGVKKTLSP